MSKLIINGGNHLRGEATVHGAKNSALPLLAAALECTGVCEIHNCPILTDISASCDILRYLGCAVRQEGHTVTVDSSCASRCDIPERLMREMRSSISFLGALLARFGEAELSLPGGCELGARPVDLHLSAMRKMGADITECHGRICCRAKGRLCGTTIALSFPSVGATENIMLAAATAEGETVISNAAREPEISDLAAFLCKCGAKISGAGESTVVINGVSHLDGCEHTVIPDRIEAATYLSAAAATGGEITLHRVQPEHLLTVIPVLESMGCSIECGDAKLRLRAPERLSSAGYVRTMPYPGFPTDAQAILMAVACAADGTSIFVENIFDSRFKHVGELCRMGASITTEGRAAVVEGVKRLTGAAVSPTDLRGAAALVIAGLAAEGTTVLDSVRHLDRGYESPEKVFAALGGRIERKE